MPLAKLGFLRVFSNALNEIDVFTKFLVSGRQKPQFRKGHSNIFGFGISKTPILLRAFEHFRFWDIKNTNFVKGIRAFSASGRQKHQFR